MTKVTKPNPVFEETLSIWDTLIDIVSEQPKSEKSENAAMILFDKLDNVLTAPKQDEKSLQPTAEFMFHLPQMVQDIGDIFKARAVKGIESITDKFAEKYYAYVERHADVVTNVKGELGKGEKSDTYTQKLLEAPLAFKSKTQQIPFAYNNFVINNPKFWITNSNYNATLENVLRLRPEMPQIKPSDVAKQGKSPKTDKKEPEVLATFYKDKHYVISIPSQLGGKIEKYFENGAITVQQFDYRGGTFSIREQNNKPSGNGGIVFASELRL